MPSFNPFSGVTGRHTYSLFDIRLDNDFIVFRGNESESSGQLLKGVVVLCLPSSLRIEDVHLRLIGSLRVSFTGVGGQKVDRNTTILEHRWAPFVGTHGKSMTLPAGNHEYPFEFMLPGDTAESLEGIPEASITYRLKATVGRGKLAYDLHSYKHLRIIRTLEPAALEFVHAMSVENIWPQKIDYSITLPRKAVCFGGKVELEMRFTPLLKGLEIGEVKVDMLETRDTIIHSSAGAVLREHRQEREVAMWKFELPREECWQDMIEDTGQEGWVTSKKLDLPKRLRQCVQDANLHGIKIRHKMRLTVALHNPDGHISELRATLPISIFISPNVPLDEQGNLVDQEPSAQETLADDTGLAPPVYGEHVLDQLYADVDMSGFRTPGFQSPGFQSPTVQSGVNSPLYAQSRSGSVENLSAMADSIITPAALQSRLANVSLDPSNRTTSYMSIHAAAGSGFNSGIASPTAGHHHSLRPVRPEHASGSRTRSNSHSGSGSGEEGSGRTSPDHLDMDMENLSRVPSYATAVRTPARSQSRSRVGAPVLPDYVTALSTPRTPPATDTMADPLTTITEGRVSNSRNTGVAQRS